ncbi:MAG: serine/threonine-protein kinase [Phycisphaerae bacterium]
MPDLLSGYNIVQRIGTGARSQIYQVIHPETGQKFALKRVIRQPHEDDRFLIQAITEYEVASQFDQPTLRKAIDCHKIRRWMRLVEVQVVLELIDGFSLDKHRLTDLNQIVDVFKHVCNGLDALHNLGFVHADMKPNNILVTNDHKIKIIDFGQSCRIGHRKERIQGTADYIAPEQVERRPLTRQTDVFNVGATLYWAVTGKNIPTMISRQDENRHSIAAPSARRNIPTPQEIDAQIPTALSRLVMECCNDRPSDRPGDMKQIISRLEVVEHVLAKRRAAGEQDIRVSEVGEPIAPSDTAKRAGAEAKKDAKAAKPARGHGQKNPGTRR